MTQLLYCSRLNMVELTAESLINADSLAYQGFDLSYSAGIATRHLF